MSTKRVYYRPADDESDAEVAQHLLDLLEASPDGEAEESPDADKAQEPEQ